MAGLGIRGFNPIWAEFDLTGNLFDDTFYLYVLQNTIPYLPSNVYHDANLQIVWNQPIQFLGNGTLPVDIFFVPGVTYRLEFRQNDGILPPSQNDPLIYEVNDYVPGEGGSTPVDSLAFATSNQVTNPQFALMNFPEPFTLTAVTNPDPIEIGVGWFLELTGTGNVTIEQAALDVATSNPTNASYALKLSLLGWDDDGVILRQRFQQNGMLWAQKVVSTTITGRLEGVPQTVRARLIDSNGTPLGDVLQPVELNEGFLQYTDYVTLPATTNPDVPPAAYIEYQLFLPTDVDELYITSIQLVVQELELEPTFEQDSVERQIDHTFHYYKDPLMFKNIPSLLTAWDFPLNPAQLGSSFTMTGSAGYTWDQTISARVTTNNAVARNAVTSGFQVTTGGNTDAFYMMQYLSGNEAKKILGNSLSVNVSAFKTQVGGDVICRVYLYRGSAAASFPTLPTSIGTLATSGIFTLSASNWTEIPRDNPLINAIGTLSTVDTGDYTTLNDVVDLKFSGWEIVDATQISDTDKFAIVVTFSYPDSSTVIVVDSISVVAGDIPTRPAAQTFERVISECQYYYEKSYPMNVIPGASSSPGIIVAQQCINDTFNDTSYPLSFSLQYKTVSIATTPIVSLYSSIGSSSGNVYSAIVQAGVISGSSANTGVSGHWTATIGNTVAQYVGSNVALLQIPAGAAFSNSFVSFHYTKDARLGVVA